MPLLGGRNGLMGTEREATALPLSLSRSLSALWFLWESWEMEEGTIASKAEGSERARESACITFAYSSSKYYNNRPNRTEREDTLNRA